MFINRGYFDIEEHHNSIRVLIIVEDDLDDIENNAFHCEYIQIDDFLYFLNAGFNEM